MKNPQWFCKNSCSFIFCQIFKIFFGLYSPLLQLFRFGVSGYTPPSPVSAEPSPWLEDTKLTFAFFLWWICSNKNIFFPLFNISTNSQYINWKFSEDFNFLMIIVYVLWVCKHDWWFFPSLASGGGGGGLGRGGIQATYIVLPLTLHAQTHTITYIHTHTHTHSQINMQYTEVFIYLFIYLLIYWFIYRVSIHFVPF